MTNVEIRVVGNGYIVRPAEDYNSRGSYTASEEVKVFETFENLVQWLSENIRISSAEGKAE